MKKIIACALIFTMCIAGFAACSKENGDPDAAPTTTVNPDGTDNQDNAANDLIAAKNYLNMMYKDSIEATPSDYKVVGAINIGGVLFNVDWTVDHESVKIVPGDDKMVTIDVDEKNPEEVTYTLTATISDGKGSKETLSFTHRVPAAIIIDAGMSYADIVDAAYSLEEGLAMEDTFRLYGTITKIDTPWSADYKNITVTITVDGKEDKPIMCYRLKGEGAENLAVGDKITVEGVIKNYKGTIEFDAGCTFLGMGEQIDQSQLLEAAYALEEGLAMTAPCILKGVITKIDTPWSADYKNITVTIVVDGKEDKPIMCYRLKGDGADTLAVGDEIAVFGTIKNYKGTIEFDAGCVLIDASALADAKLAVAAYALEEGLALTDAATLTGVITSVDTAYSADYKNVTVTIAVAGLTDYPIQCFRLKGDGADTIGVGDKITVTGILKNYKGTIEFDAGCNLDAVVK